MVVLRVLNTLGKLDGDFRGDSSSVGRRGRTRTFDWDLPHIWRRMTGEMDLSMMDAGHFEKKMIAISRQRSELSLSKSKWRSKD